MSKCSLGLLGRSVKTDSASLTLEIRRIDFACLSGGFPFLDECRECDAIAKMDAHHRLLIGFIVLRWLPLFADACALDGRRSPLMMPLPSPFLFDWVTVTLTPREQIRAVAQRQDVGARHFIFVIMWRAPLFSRRISDPKRNQRRGTCRFIWARPRHGGAFMATDACRLRTALRPQIL